MKTIFFLFWFLLLFLGIFFVLSLIGCIWANYHQVITQPNWLVIYGFFGWIIPTISCLEISEKLDADYSLKEIFTIK